MNALKESAEVFSTEILRDFQISILTEEVEDHNQNKDIQLLNNLKAEPNAILDCDDNLLVLQ